MASLTEDLARWLFNHDPDRQKNAIGWYSTTHERKEEYRKYATDLQNYLASVAHMPEETIPPGMIPVRKYYRRKPINANSA